MDLIILIRYIKNLLANFCYDNIQKNQISFFLLNSKLDLLTRKIIGKTIHFCKQIFMESKAIHYRSNATVFNLFNSFGDDTKIP